MIPSELTNQPRMVQAVYQATTAQVIRAVVAVVLLISIVVMTFLNIPIPELIEWTFIAVIGSYFEVSKPTSPQNDANQR